MCRLLLSTLSSITSTLFGFSLAFETLQLASWNDNVAYNMHISNRNLMKCHSVLSRMNLDQNIFYVLLIYDSPSFSIILYIVHLYIWYILYIINT